MRDAFERGMFGSKKAVAYLIAELMWKAIIVFMIVMQVDWWIVLSTVIITGFIEVGYIGGQAWLDRYVRVAAMALPGEDDKG